MLLRVAILVGSTLLGANPVANARVVAVDVGHTLSAPGAISARGRSEYAFNLELARQVVEALRDRGLSVHLINADGMIASLRERPAQAAGHGADLLISLHHDSVSAHELQPWTWNGEVRDYNDDFAGHSVFVSRENPDLPRSELC
ncbi:MAG: N-acetylmuramoyl-L-alanine amidase, partial [Betaproteobacteria bacterium HGW-Betaproteobacteria-21]